MPGSISRQPPKLLEQVRQVLHLHHDSIHTERASLEWIVRYVRFHRMRCRDELFPPEPNIEAVLTDLAVNGNSGKGDRDRVAILPATLTPLLQNHLARVRTLHQEGPAQGHGAVYLSHALERKYPPAPKAWGGP